MLLVSPLEYFTDSILRAPTIGSMLMCFTAGIVGTIVFLRKQSLIGEALSHAAYPGVILGVICAGMIEIDSSQSFLLSFLIIIGAFFTTLLGAWCINFLIKKAQIRPDSALCFVLSGFFGIGLTLASQVQFTYSSLYQQIQVYLYGQAATMTDIHIQIYLVLAIVVSVTIICLYKEIQLITFDEDYAKSLGFNTRLIDSLFFILMVLAVVIGIRSVGVVLMSAMLIAPAAAARQFTNKLSIMLILASIFGIFSGYFGNYFSVELTNYFQAQYPDDRFSIPTGPMIVMVAASICIISLAFSPKRGILIRLFRVANFRYKCTSENILKAIWRIAPDTEVSVQVIANYQNVSKLYLKFILLQLTRQGWIENTKKNHYKLTKDGKLRAEKIIRLHRLWEVYLADYLGVGAERVHKNAEEMEHIITPEIERELTLLLKDPKKDPHHQPIPSLKGL